MKGTTSMTARTSRLLTAVTFAAGVVSLVGACGGSPATPTPAVVAALTISPLTATVEPTSAGFMYHVSYQLKETSGRSAATLTDVTYTLASGAALDPALASPIKVAAGGSASAGTVNVADTSGRGKSNQVTVRVTFTDDNGRTGTSSASAAVTDVAPPVPVETFLVSGTVTDAVTGAALAGVHIALTDAAGAARRVDTSSAGEFGFPAVAPGSYQLSAAATGYQTSTQTVAITTADARLTIALRH
jgi:carboxypeptidase family protein